MRSRETVYFVETTNRSRFFLSIRPRNVTFCAWPTTRTADAAIVPFRSVRAVMATRSPTLSRAAALVWTSATLLFARVIATRCVARCTLSTTPLASAADGASNAPATITRTARRFIIYSFEGWLQA